MERKTLAIFPSHSPGPFASLERALSIPSELLASRIGVAWLSP
jgi:hypothetical protein